MAPSGLVSSQTDVGLPYRYMVSVLLLMFGQPCASGVEINAAAFLLLTPPALIGNLSSNNILLNAERIHQGQISIPHSYVTSGDDMYAATASGLVVNVASCRPVVIANLRPRGCRTLQECGHLTSIRLTSDNLLLALDAYRGVFEVHPVTGVIRHLYDSRIFVSGRPCVYLNDLVVMKDGTIIMSDSSPRFDYDHEFWIRFEARPDGRLIGFSPASGQSKEILSGLAYPTGLEITNNGQALMVSEASRARILRLELSKDRLFQRSYVNINLPGMPEHIRKSGRGTYWVGLSYPRYRGETSMLDQYSNVPVTRNFLAVRRTINDLKLMYKRRGLALELNESGKILRSIHDPSGLKVGEVLEVTEFSGVLYVGTRAQQATVRVVGSPSELTVDSLVQVLRGRCTVAEDKIQATKESIQKQLKGIKPNQSQKTTAKPQQYTTSSPIQTTTTVTEASVTEKPKQKGDLQSLSLGLSLLHRAILDITSYNTKSPSTASPQTQVVGQDVAWNQQGEPTHPPNVFISIKQDAVIFNDQQNNSQSGSSTMIPTENPFQPLQVPQHNVAPQNTEIISSTQRNVGSSTFPTQAFPTQPHTIQSVQEGHMINQVVLGKNVQVTLAGYSPSQRESETSYANVPIELSQLTAPKQTYTSISRVISTSEPVIQQLTGHQQQNVNFGSAATESVPQQNSATDTSDLGGFMGFLGNSVQNSLLSNSRNQVTQNPYAFAVHEPGMYGQIEPVLDMNSGSSSHKHQFLPGMESVANYEQSNVPKETPKKVKQMSVNETHTPPYNLQNEPVNSFKPRGQKRLDMNVQDISIKDATEIQNMQMFHPTDRPEQLPLLQNQASTKTESSFQDKASILNHEAQQFDIISQDLNQGAQYISAQEGYNQAQVPQLQSQAPQKVQDTNVFEHGHFNRSTFQGRASVLNREPQQFHVTSQDLTQGASYTSSQNDHIQAQVPQLQSQAPQKAQDTNVFERGHFNPSTFQGRASVLNREPQHFHVTSQDLTQGASYTSSQNDHIQAQLPQLQSQAPQKAQYTNVFEREHFNPSTFQGRASVVNREPQQFHVTSQDLTQGASYTSSQNDHIQAQVPQVQTQPRRKAQDTNNFGHGQFKSSTAGSAMRDKPHTSHFSSDVQVEGFDPGAPINQGSSVGNMYDPTFTL